MAAIQTIHCKKIVRPLRTTFATARGSKTCATSVIVTVSCDNGAVGIGEVPTSFVVPQETPEVIRRTIHRSRMFLCGRPVDQWASLGAELRACFSDFHMTCSGLEVAMLRAHLACEGKSEHAFWGGACDTVTSDITIPFVPAIEELSPWIRRAVRSGFDIYKIKINGNIKQDVAFIRAVRSILSESNTPYTVRLDGNQGFTCDSALRLLDALPEPVELFEQPLKHDDYTGMKQLCRKCPVPVIADETVFTVQDAHRVIEQQLAHGINIKFAKSGIAQSGQIIRMVQEAGLKLMLGCMTETMTGLSAAIYCAAGTGLFDYIDLDGVHFMNHRKTYQDITVDGPVYRIGEKT